MASITIDLSESQLQKLEDLANLYGVPIEVLLKAGLEDWLNGLEISASVDDQEAVVLAIAAGELGREGFVDWLQQNTAAMLHPYSSS
jgi:hypothetical protein